MNKKIVVYKSLEDYNKSFELLKKEYKNLQMTIVDDVKKVKDFSFKDYELVISYNFNNLEKKILSDKFKFDSRKTNMERRLLHK